MNRALLKLLEEAEDFQTQVDMPRATSDEPMRKPNYKARKHGKPCTWVRGFMRDSAELVVLVAFIGVVGMWAIGLA